MQPFNKDEYRILQLIKIHRIAVLNNHIIIQKDAEHKLRELYKKIGIEV